MSVKFCISL